MKIFNITFRPDPGNPDETETVTYEAKSLDSAQGKFLNDYPDQAGEYRETHMPLSNYEVDRKNAESTVKETEIEKPNGLFDRLFANATVWVKLFTALLIGLIGLGLVSSALFGIDGGFGIVTNISNLLSNFQGLTGLVVLFLVYFLFIRSGNEKKS